MEHANLFDEVLSLPNPEAREQLDALVGLDHAKELLFKEGRLLLNPELLSEWSEEFHKSQLLCVKEFQKRPPLLLFSGDVGTGKTTLANTFGDAIARSEKIDITVVRLSLMARGRGAVGEMTHLISQAFEEVENMAKRGFVKGKKPRSAVIFIIDEADSIAESRSTEQMHHEDKAGVNALIRGVDRFTQESLPVLIVLCTNRQEVMDPAVLRRAVGHHKFERPTPEQISYILKGQLGKNIFTDSEFDELVKLMTTNQKRKYGYTFSDIVQRFLPSLLLEAFPDKAITFDLAAFVAKKMEPVKPFKYE